VGYFGFRSVSVPGHSNVANRTLFRFPRRSRKIRCCARDGRTPGEPTEAAHYQNIVAIERFDAHVVSTAKLIMKTLARIGAVLAFLFCFTGGLWLLTSAGFNHKDDALPTALGLYFIGKSFFVGPMLWLAAEKCCAKDTK
jgi:hypothetical protein